MSNKIKLTFGYDGTDFTRNLTLNGVESSVTAAPATIVTKIKAVNASIAGGTDGGLGTFFLADDYDGTDGKFAGITAAQIITQEVTNINLDEEGE